MQTLLPILNFRHGSMFLLDRRRRRLAGELDNNAAGVGFRVRFYQRRHFIISAFCTLCDHVDEDEGEGRTVLNFILLVKNMFSNPHPFNWRSATRRWQRRPPLANDR
jgi:hypothetical protein